MIDNEMRDFYKLVKLNSKNKQETILEKKDQEYSIAEKLIKLNFLKKIETDNKFKYFINENTKLPRKSREKAYQKIKINNKFYPIKRCEKPKFGGKGRTWEIKKFILNDIETEFHFDTTWGDYIYFTAEDGRWYKIGSSEKFVIENDLGYEAIDLIWFEQVNNTYTIY